MRRSDKTKTIRSVKRPHTWESQLSIAIAHFWRSRAVRSCFSRLNPSFWGGTARPKQFSGWIADEALGRSYVELCLPMEARESFLAELARVITGAN